MCKYFSKEPKEFLICFDTINNELYSNKYKLSNNYDKTETGIEIEFKFRI